MAPWRYYSALKYSNMSQAPLPWAPGPWGRWVQLLLVRLVVFSFLFFFSPSF